MPSTWSSRFRLNFQAPGENLNTWGGLLNVQVFQLLEDAIAKRQAFSLSGSKTLTTANGAEDEARCAFLDVTSGTGGTITIPPLEKIYLVRNAASGSVIVTTGAGVTATIVAGEMAWVSSDGSNVRKALTSDFGGARITSVGSPLAATDAVPRSYVDSFAFGVAELPGQAGSAGYFLTTDGTTPSWEPIGVSDVAGAAPIDAPSFTNGVTVAGGAEITGVVAQTGGSVANVDAMAALDIDFSVADGHTKSISSNSAFTFSGLVAGKLQCALLTLTISSSAVPSWPASVRHPTGVNPSTSLGNGKHLLGLITSNGGTDVVLVVLARNFS